MIRVEVYKSAELEPDPARAFVAVCDIVEVSGKPPLPRTIGHIVFYGATERDARTRAETFIETERKRLLGLEAQRLERLADARNVRARNRPGAA